jgi:hypothetical protein
MILLQRLMNNEREKLLSEELHIGAAETPLVNYLQG